MQLLIGTKTILFIYLHVIKVRNKILLLRFRHNGTFTNWNEVDKCVFKFKWR